MRLPLRLTFLIPLLLLAVAAVRGAFEEMTPPPDITVPRAVVFDVGQGDAILLDGPGHDAEVLVDGGTDADALREDLHRALGRDRTINLVVLTHPHLDHLAGLADVIARYDVARVLFTGVVHTTGAYERFLTAIRDRGVPTTVAVAGQSYDIGPFHLDILAPLASLDSQRVENLNSSSIVMMATIEADSQKSLAISKTHRLLLTGDAEADVETAVLERYCASSPSPGPSPLFTIVRSGEGGTQPCAALAADVLKVPHHGSQDSSSDAFLAAVAPQHAIISSGAGNDYGHPHRRALKRLERTGARIWRTDEQGTITVEFAPEGLRVVGER